MKQNWNQLIERYLNNELSAEGKTAFEAELKINQELQQELELHRLTIQVIQRNSLRTLVKQSGKWFYLKKMLFTGGMILALASVIGLSVYFIASGLDKSSDNEPAEQIEQVLLEQMKKHLAFDNIPAQYFKFTGQPDVFLSSTGVLLSLTEQSFLLNGQPYSGEAVVQWQEAQEASDFAKAGLSTRAGDKLLETQGMFNLTAFTPNGKKLELSKEGAYIQVPVDEVKEGMKLFQGVSQPNGDVNWQNPVELERLPKSKNMSEMDLYPSEYESKLNELKWHTEKEKRDSLYLSFEHFNRSSDSVVTEPYPELSSQGFHIDERQDFIVFDLGDPPGNNKIDGEHLFKRKCSTCHHPVKNRIGPELKGVREKWAYGSSKKGSIYQWVKDWEKAAHSDPYARKITMIKPTSMDKFPDLSAEEIDAIFDYIDGMIYFIPPSKVLAIWKEQFNTTNLATQDFEDRMKLIHETCDEELLDLYIKNLHELLWKLDERAVAMGYSQFQQFANQRVGKIAIDDAHQKNLNAFYEKTIREIRKMGQQSFEEALRKEQKWDNELQNERSKEIARKGIRESQNLEEEYNFNHKNVRKQLGITAGFKMTTNIVNIDKYVREATIARKTTDIINPLTGEKGKITYNSVTAEVKNANQYDKLYLYLFSEEMNSYQRLDFESGKLNYSLNGDMNYSAMLIGVNKNGYFYHHINQLVAGNLGIITLEEISEQEFDKRINALNNDRNKKPMDLSEELKWLFKEKANYEIQEQRKKDTEFRAIIQSVVFPCTETREIVKPVE